MIAATYTQCPQEIMTSAFDTALHQETMKVVVQSLFPKGTSGGQP